MPIANYSTSVSALKTVSEIQAILVDHGARSIVMNYNDDGTVKSLTFMIEVPGGWLPIRLPVDAVAVQKVMVEQGLKPHETAYEQAMKTAWRIIKDWVRAQMALLETDMVKMDQVFLPYVLMKDNKKTLYEYLSGSGFLLGGPPGDKTGG